ncbi:helix-turn-helix domain-containing protein [Flavobacterium aestivum]|uniref:helix-turn-helix domain-containing protein n=1 Tax=Flavobacterium aestivum TaxID=3003257 RepID=UPI002482D0F7|nr:AraC family transcriptional regulator [Flavobacterium aestivum]
MIRKKIPHSCLEFEVITLEKFSSKIVIEELVHSNCFSVIIVNSGSITVRINQIEFCIQTKELLVIPVGISLEILQICDDLEASLLFFTSEFIFKNTITKPNIGFFEFFITKSPKKVVLRDNDSLLLNDLFLLLGNENYKIREYMFYSEIQLLSFNLLLYVLAGIYNENFFNLKTKHSRKEILIFRFLEILNTHCTREHSVKFYSDALHISPGHLSKIVKQVTNKTIKQFINEAIVLESKILLRNGDLTILQIIEELHFSNSSSFSNFFKKNTSMSPSEYRLNLKLK